MKPQKYTVVLVDRANYGRMKPVMEAMREHPMIDLSVVCAGSMLLDKFGTTRDVVAADGFNIDAEVYMEVEGSVPVTMTKSIGMGIMEFSSVFQQLKPDFLVMIGDRYEAMAAVIAAVFQNICLIHIQGGEVSGSIDESTRHAITKFAHYHFPSTKRAGEYIVAMGEEEDKVFPLGCPSADVVTNAASRVSQTMLNTLGVGGNVDFSKPYALVLFHPVTTEYGTAEEQMEAILYSLYEMGKQVLLLWPNIDAGSDGVAQAIRRFREFNPDAPLHAYKNFEPEVYIPLLANAEVLVGNSSSFIRDASFVGTPVVLVGNRQDGRERCEAVRRVKPIKDDIALAIKEQIAHGKYEPSDLYGRPGVSEAIAEAMANFKPYTQKRLAYAAVKETVGS